jgi:DNA-binding response OmpR family regulator
MALRVLVVDDDAVLLRVFCEFLVDEGMTADGVPTVDAAKRAIDTGEYDVVILDMLLGATFGTALLTELCDRVSSPRVLALSATPSEARWAARYGVPFLAKPFVIESLLEAIARAQRPQRTRPSNSSRRRPVLVIRR